MFAIVGNIVTSILGGLLISVVAVAILLFVIHLLFPRYLASETAFSLIIGFILFNDYPHVVRLYVLDLKSVL